jgi:hypothetical protein
VFPLNKTGRSGCDPERPAHPHTASDYRGHFPIQNQCNLSHHLPPPRQIWSYLDRLCRFFPALFAFQGVVPTSISNLLNFLDGSPPTPRHTPC